MAARSSILPGKSRGQRGLAGSMGSQSDPLSDQHFHCLSALATQQVLKGLSRLTHSCIFQRQPHSKSS